MMVFTYAWESESDFKKALGRINAHLEAIKKNNSCYHGLIEFVQDTLPFLEEKWEFFQTTSNPGGGRRRISRLSLFYCYIYLLYFSRDNLSRTFRKIDNNRLLRQILMLNNERITRPTFYRFINWLSNDILTQIFDSVVKLGIKKKIIKLNSHIIDSGMIYANINNNRFMLMPRNSHNLIIDLYEEIDWQFFDSLHQKHSGRKYTNSIRLKLLLLPIIAGLPSYTLVYNFLKRYPLLRIHLGLGCQLPTGNNQQVWMNSKFFKQPLEKYYQSLVFSISCYLFSHKFKLFPKLIQTIDSFYGILGTNYSRADRGARIGYKTSTKSFWIGYKDHISIDAESRLPVLVTITSANVHDTMEYVNHLKYLKTKYQNYVDIKHSYGDKGYDNKVNRKACQAIWNAKPLITSRGASLEQQKLHKKWSGVRQRVEQTISRVVLFTRKNYPRIRGRSGVYTWTQMGYLIVLMIGLKRFLNNENHLAFCTNLYLD